MTNSSFSFWRLIKKDIERYLYFSRDFIRERKGIIRKISVFLTPCLLCCFFYRLSHLLFRRGWRRLAAMIVRINFLLNKADISPDCKIGAGLYIPHTVGIILNGHAGINLTLYAFSAVTPLEGSKPGHQGDQKYRPVLGNNVTLGSEAMVLGSVKVGNDVIVGAKVSLVKDIPDKAKIYTPYESTCSIGKSEEN